MRRFASIASALVLLGACPVVPAAAQEESAGAPQSLDALLERVRQGNRAEEEENARRLAEFRAAKTEHERLLTDALREKAALEQRSAELEREFEANEARIPELEETLRNRQGSLGELFGVVRQVAGDTRAEVESSLVSAQIPGRAEFLGGLAQSRTMPSIDDLERLWFVLQEQMTEAGKVVAFPATVVTVGGGEETKQVVRVGAFNAVADGRYLQYLSETGKLAELARQPASRHLRTVERLESAESGLVGFSLDPSRGSLLSMLIETPTLDERVDQGGLVGYVIIVLGVLGFVLALYRIGYLAVVGRKMGGQVGARETRLDNPLGRVLSVYDQNRAADVETVELKLDEAILKETPHLERGNNLIKVLTVVAPLLGLLGTVTGMIKTFQAITLFGAGDPRLMAGGISEALVTTALGLTVAVPLVLLHSIVSGRSRTLVEVLEEESAGMIAAHSEEQAVAEGTRRAAAV